MNNQEQQSNYPDGQDNQQPVNQEVKKANQRLKAICEHCHIEIQKKNLLKHTKRCKIYQDHQTTSLEAQVIKDEQLLGKKRNYTEFSSLQDIDQDQQSDFDQIKQLFKAKIVPRSPEKKTIFDVTKTKRLKPLPLSSYEREQQENLLREKQERDAFLAEGTPSMSLNEAYAIVREHMPTYEGTKSQVHQLAHMIRDGKILNHFTYEKLLSLDRFRDDFFLRMKLQKDFQMHRFDPQSLLQSHSRLEQLKITQFERIVKQADPKLYYNLYMQRPAKPINSWRLTHGGTNQPEDRIQLVDPTTLPPGYSPPYIPTELLLFKDDINGIYSYVNTFIIYNDMELDEYGTAQMPETVRDNSEVLGQNQSIKRNRSYKLISAKHENRLKDLTKKDLILSRKLDETKSSFHQVLTTLENNFDAFEGLNTGVDALLTQMNDQFIETDQLYDYNNKQIHQEVEQLFGIQSKMQDLKKDRLGRKQPVDPLTNRSKLENPAEIVHQDRSRYLFFTLAKWILLIEQYLMSQNIKPTTTSFMEYLKCKARAKQGFFRYNYYIDNVGYLGLSQFTNRDRQNSLFIYEGFDQNGKGILVFKFQTNSYHYVLQQLQHQGGVPIGERRVFHKDDFLKSARSEEQIQLQSRQVDFVESLLKTQIDKNLYEDPSILNSPVSIIQHEIKTDLEEFLAYGQVVPVKTQSISHPFYTKPEPIKKQTSQSPQHFEMIVSKVAPIKKSPQSIQPMITTQPNKETIIAKQSASPPKIKAEELKKEQLITPKRPKVKKQQQSLTKEQSTQRSQTRNIQNLSSKRVRFQNTQGMYDDKPFKQEPKVESKLDFDTRNYHSPMIQDNSIKKELNVTVQSLNQDFCMIDTTVTQNRSEAQLTASEEKLISRINSRFQEISSWDDELEVEDYKGLVFKTKDQVIQEQDYNEILFGLPIELKALKEQCDEITDIEVDYLQQMADQKLHEDMIFDSYDALSDCDETLAYDTVKIQHGIDQIEIKFGLTFKGLKLLDTLVQLHNHTKVSQNTLLDKISNKIGQYDRHKQILVNLNQQLYSEHFRKLLDNYYREIIDALFTIQNPVTSYEMYMNNMRTRIQPIHFLNQVDPIYDFNDASYSIITWQPTNLLERPYDLFNKLKHKWVSYIQIATEYYKAICCINEIYQSILDFSSRQIIRGRGRPKDYLFKYLKSITEQWANHHLEIKCNTKLKSSRHSIIVENLKTLAFKVQTALAPGTIYVEAIGKDLLSSYPDIFAYRQENYDDIQRYMTLETYTMYCNRIAEIIGFNADWISQTHLVMIYIDQHSGQLTADEVQLISRESTGVSSYDQKRTTIVQQCVKEKHINSNLSKASSINTKGTKSRPKNQ